MQEERADLVRQLEKMNARKAELRTAIDKCREFDPEILDEMRSSGSRSKMGANRWTGRCLTDNVSPLRHVADNIYSIKKYCKAKYGMEEKAMDEQFEVPEDLDYLE
jgi:hypothetical protein